MPPLAGAAPPTPTFFATAATFRAWLPDHHATATALWVSFVVKRKEHDA